MRYFFPASIALIFLIHGCTKPVQFGAGDDSAMRPQTFVLSWNNYDGSFENRAHAVYVLNGQALGTGEVGYEALIKRVQTMAPGSIIKIQYKVPDKTGGGDQYHIPLNVEHPGDEHHEGFYVLTDRRQVKLEFPPGDW